MPERFDLMNPKFEETGRLQIKSGDGNRLYIFDFRQGHPLPRQHVADLDQLLQDYHAALSASVNVIYQVAQWAARPVEDGGTFDNLVMLLPGIERALSMANIDLDETAVKPP